VAQGDGTVTVRTSSGHVSTERLASSYIDDNLPAGRYATLEVSDTGAGIRETDMSRVFDPFSTKRPGRGLGLSVVLGIVRGHRGAIEVSSSPDRGTTFRALLPCSGAPTVAVGSAALPVASSEPALPEGPRTVLVVEDEPMVREVVRASLELEAYEVLEADSGQRAIELLRAHAAEIDLVLLDLTMPGLSGKETLVALRRIKPDVPVLVTSGYCESDAASHFVGEPIGGFLQKPYTPGDLHRAVRSVLGAGAGSSPRTPTP
jgi:CheY-like chemotaxis protein